jgi:HSP20 family protein
MMVTRYPLFFNDSLRDAVDRLFNDPLVRTFTSPQRSIGTFSIPVDIFATDSEVFVIATAPGVSPDDLEVSIDGDALTLSGVVPNVAQSTEAEGATWFLKENGHGQFRRTVSLPVEVDADRAEAEVEHGVLRLRLPKAEAARPRQIKVRSAEPIEVAAESGPNSNGASEQKA